MLKGGDEAGAVVLLDSNLPDAVVFVVITRTQSPALAGSELPKLARPRPSLTHHQIKFEEPKII